MGSEISSTRRNFCPRNMSCMGIFRGSKSGSTRPRSRDSKSDPTRVRSRVLEKSAIRGFFDAEMCPTRVHFELRNLGIYDPDFETSKSRSTRSRFRSSRNCLYTRQFREVGASLIRTFKTGEVLRNVVFGTRVTKMTQKQHIGNFQI